MRLFPLVYFGTPITSRRRAGCHVARCRQGASFGILWIGTKPLDKRPNAKRAFLFNTLIWLNLPLVVFNALVLCVQFNVELSQYRVLGWFTPVEIFFG